jgi:hypothetical protein
MYSFYLIRIMPKGSDDVRATLACPPYLKPHPQIKEFFGYTGRPKSRHRLLHAGPAIEVPICQWLGKFFTAAGETCGGAMSAIDGEEKGYKMEINEKKKKHVYY